MKKVAVFLADGFEEIEALTVVDVLRRAGINCDMVSITDNLSVKGTHSILVEADRLMDDSLKEYDMLVMPGGLPGASNLADSRELVNLVKYFNDAGKYIAAICASPAYILPAAGIEYGKNITSYPGEEFERRLSNANYTEDIVCHDGNIITSRGPATALPFAYKLVEVLCGNSEGLENGMLWNLIG